MRTCWKCPEVPGCFLHQSPELQAAWASLTRMRCKKYGIWQFCCCATPRTQMARASARCGLRRCVKTVKSVGGAEAVKHRLQWDSPQGARLPSWSRVGLLTVRGCPVPLAHGPLSSPCRLLGCTPAGCWLGPPRSMWVPLLSCDFPSGLERPLAAVRPPMRAWACRPAAAGASARRLAGELLAGSSLGFAASHHGSFGLAGLDLLCFWSGHSAKRLFSHYPP